MYCQALDSAGSAGHRNGGKPPLRMIAVRFGNVWPPTDLWCRNPGAQIEAMALAQRMTHPGHGALFR